MAERQVRSIRAVISSALNEIEDPHLGIGLVDMGMVHGIQVDGSVVCVRVALPCLGCPALTRIRGDIVDRVSRIPGVELVTVELAWDVEWTKNFMTADATASLKGIGITV